MGLVRELWTTLAPCSVVCVHQTDLPTGGLSRLSCIFFFACSRYVVLTGLVLVTRPSLILKDRLNIVEVDGVVSVEYRAANDGIVGRR